MNKLKLYEINPQYLNYLHSIDNKVSLEHEHANKRKFIGIVLEINNNYFCPYISINFKLTSLTFSSSKSY